MSDFKIYNIKRKIRKGIDDLKNIYAFLGNSQGDESYSNEIKDYEASEGWMSFVFEGVDPTDQQAIYDESARRKKENDDYIADLIVKGEYGKEWEHSITMHLKPNPLFDHPEQPKPFGDSHIFIPNNID